MVIKKEQFLSDLKVGDLVETTFIVSEKQVKKKKNGQDYCTVTLQDSSGTLEGVLWTEVFQGTGVFLEGDLVEVKGIIKEYKGSRQLIIDTLVKIEKAAGQDLSDYIKSTTRDIESMFEEILGYIESFKNKYLKELLNIFVNDKKFVSDYKSSTAAVRYHHAYQGGLLEHSLNVVKICDMLTNIYNNLNRDLLLAGAILHDVGKMSEYSSGVNIKMTNRGKLLGHITIGYGWVLEKIGQVSGFPEDLADRLLHIILSHHGHLEYGSPKRPKILEAFIVYHVDHLDGDIGGFNIILENANNENEWSEYVRNFERPVYIKQLDLGEEGLDDGDLQGHDLNRSTNKDPGTSSKDTGQNGLF
ncbi:MAG: HD domain-containing protein [Actinobacteria bacterium]|nr:HD domain-containing protein [Actinomycetota bacterium]